MTLYKTKSERTYPKVSKQSGIRYCFGSRMAIIPSTQDQALDSRSEEACSGTVRDARRFVSLLTVS